MRWKIFRYDYCPVTERDSVFCVKFVESKKDAIEYISQRNGILRNMPGYSPSFDLSKLGIDIKKQFPIMYNELTETATWYEILPINPR